MKSLPIILVHGYGGNPRVMNTLGSFFIDNGYSKVYKFDYEETTKEKIEKNANRLWLWLNEKNLVSSKIILIGHSMGGLVVRKVAADHPTLDVVKLITLAAPNRGARFADWCPGSSWPCNDAFVDMAPDSNFLTELNKINHTYSEEKVLTYAITNDELVYPSSAIIFNALHLVVSSYTKGSSEIHSSILEKEEVFNALLKFINGDIKTIDYGPRLRDADCTIWSIYDNCTIRWDIPSGAPKNLQMNIAHYVYFNISSATDQLKENMSKGTASLRFCDLESGIITKYSRVLFKDEYLECKSYINNYHNIIKTWPK